MKNSELRLHRRINERARMKARVKPTGMSGQIINLALFLGIYPYDYLIDKFYGIGSKVNQYPYDRKNAL